MHKHYPMPMLIIFSILLFIFSCSGGKMTDERAKFGSIKDIPDSVWEKLSNKKIYFGHMSVGYNIIDGIKDLMEENPKIKIDIVETSDKADFKAGVFAHSRVGKNGDPRSKIDDFKRFVEEGVGDNADMAFLKFCYLDFMADAEPRSVLDEYKKTMSLLRKTYPNTTFIHITAPLTRKQTGVKAWIKKIIGRPIWGVEDNMKKFDFNELLKNEYDGKDPVFDLAEIESTLPDGSRLSYSKDGKTYYAMVPEYTTDGGHLNKIGRKKVAEQLLILLANLS